MIKNILVSPRIPALRRRARARKGSAFKDLSTNYANILLLRMCSDCVGLWTYPSPHTTQ